MTAIFRQRQAHRIRLIHQDPGQLGVLTTIHIDVWPTLTLLWWSAYLPAMSTTTPGSLNVKNVSMLDKMLHSFT